MLNYKFLSHAFIVFVYTILCSSVFAKVYCKDTRALEHLVIDEGVDLSCDETASIDDFVGEILNLSPVSIKNSSLRITMNHIRKASITGSGVHMNLTRNFQHSIQDQAVLAHELGHVVFDSYFYNNIPSINRERELSLQINEKVSLVVGDVSNCQTEKQVQECRRKLSYIKKELELLEEERDALIVKNKMREEFLSELVRPYNEFVSDAVAALYFESPTIMNKSLLMISPDRAARNIECRSFLIESEYVYAFSDHCALSGTRAFIWEKTLLPGIESGEKAKALEHLLQMVTFDILKYYNSLEPEDIKRLSQDDNKLLKTRTYIRELNSLYSLLRGKYEVSSSQLVDNERNFKQVDSENLNFSNEGTLSNTYIE